MRAFLSHSSKDKGFVEAVADLLRPGTFELDSQTFDAGLINSAAIMKSLERSDLFCLFLSEHSVKSPYVNFETLLGIEFFARGSVERFLAICLDDASFEKASENIKFFNVVRKGGNPESVARLIQGQLISAAKRGLFQNHPFVGREDDLLELERQVTNHEKPPTKALFISGNFGSGRRTLAEKFYANIFPQVGRVFPVIKVDAFAGLEELHRKFLSSLRPSMTAKELKTRIQSFQVASDVEKRRLVAQLINSLIQAREAVFLLDDGGMLTDSGGLEPEINSVIDLFDARPFPPAIIVGPRMIPRRLRRAEDDLSYLAIRSLTRDASSRLISRLLREEKISSDDLEKLVVLGDGHPFNIYRMVEEINDKGLPVFLANPTNFIEWKHRQSSEYLNKITFNSDDKAVLGLLKIVPELDFQGIADALQMKDAVVSDTLVKLVDLHVLEIFSERFGISPPLRIAVEKDRRLSLSGGDLQKALTSLATTLSVRIEDGAAPISLIDAAVLASLESNGSLTDFASVFLLPSHYVWLAKRQYDQQNFQESIRLAQDALKSSSRLSIGGTVAASRYLCLSAARIGEDATFEEGIKRLVGIARDNWAKSNIAYLRGFSLRFKGNLPAAEEQFRDAYKLSPGNLHASREIAAICLARGNLDEAEDFAREALSHAPSNPYLIDILISVLVRRHGRSAKHISEIHELFDTLEKVGEEGGRSFFTTRKAEFEHLWGSNKVAMDLIETALDKTPRIFEAQRLKAEILLKDGKKSNALEVINLMRDIVNARDPRERRSNYRGYLETQAHYLQEIDRFDDAKKIYDDHLAFTDAERAKAIREIEIVQSYKKR